MIYWQFLYNNFIESDTQLKIGLKYNNVQMKFSHHYHLSFIV